MQPNGSVSFMKRIKVDSKCDCLPSNFLEYSISNIGFHMDFFGKKEEKKHERTRKEDVLMTELIHPPLRVSVTTVQRIERLTCKIWRL